ncbi:MAG: RDD family protein [Acidimicrobiales bacterium]
MPGRNLPNGIVTPEAVLLDFAAAGVGTRLLSRMLDMVVVMGLLYAGAFGLIVAAFVSETFLLVVGLIGLFLIIFGYPVVTETFLGGRTFGKMALGLRVVSTEGAPVTFGQTAIRSIMAIPDIYLTSGGAAIISVLLTSRGQRLGDLVADTMVIRDSKARKRAPAIQFPIPFGFEAYAGQLDVSRINREQYRLIRGFLSRVVELRPDVRASMAERIAVPIAQHIGHARPANVHPETFLACVASRYQHASLVS